MSRAPRTRPAALLWRALFTVMAIVAVQLVTAEGAPPVFAQLGAPTATSTSAAAAPTMTTHTPTPSTATAVPAASPAPVAVATVATDASIATPPPAPPAPPVDPGAAPVPVPGQATAWGCSAALAYLQAYAAKGFAFECPGYAEGQEAMTCLHVAGVCPTSAVIAIADPCPQAYMNEASNSSVLTGVSDSPIDPYGPCPSVS